MGIAQNPGLSSDPSSYSKDDFNVIPKKLYKSLIECFLDNDYNPSDKLGPKIIKETTIRESIDSKIIAIQHVELILKWIDKLEIMDEIKNLYEFKLIFRGSRDGFTPETFHEICDNQSHTFYILYSFINKHINDHVISRVKKDKYSINYWDRYGPSYDLIIRGGTVNNYCGNESYQRNRKFIFRRRICSISNYEKLI
ncbi:hypothetical protein RhiirB3_453310 [Rhizophagus irregularis]|nr:hypothetical protein RhiirB3_453310 [Rhizophagus irregularis]